MATQNDFMKNIMPSITSSLVSAGLVALMGYIFLVEKNQLELQNIKSSFDKMGVDFKTSIERIENEFKSYNQQIFGLKLIIIKTNPKISLKDLGSLEQQYINLINKYSLKNEDVAKILDKINETSQTELSNWLKQEYKIADQDVDLIASLAHKSEANIKVIAQSKPYPAVVEPDLASDRESKFVEKLTTRKLQLAHSEGQIKAQDDHGRQINELLRQASLNMQENKFMVPANNNAYIKYREAIKLDPDNRMAKDGLNEIANKYLELAKNANNSGNKTRSMNYINRALKVIQENRDSLEKPLVVKIEALSSGLSRQWSEEAGSR